MTTCLACSLCDVEIAVGPHPTKASGCEGVLSGNPGAATPVDRSPDAEGNVPGNVLYAHRCVEKS